MKQRGWEPWFSGQRMPEREPSSSHLSRSTAIPSLESDEEQERPVLAPSHVQYEDATTRLYLVRSLSNDRLVEVPKRYARATPFPFSHDQRPPGATLQRWSSYALLAVGLFGVGGILLGTVVAGAAGVRLIGFAQRVRGWKPGSRRLQMLPVAAGEERLRLLGALGQGLLAVLLGVVVFAAMIWHLW